MINISTLQLNNNLLSMGAILGTSGSAALIDNINQQYGGSGSFFGSAADPFRTGFQNFMMTVVQPIRETQHILHQTASKLFRKDEIRVINSLEELAAGIPPSMHAPLLYYPPIRQMLLDGRIDGFGVPEETMVEEDVYGRLISNHMVTFTSADIADDNTVLFSSTTRSTDPELTPEQIEAIEVTRWFADAFITGETTKHMDFTDYPNLHG